MVRLAPWALILIFLEDADNQQDILYKNDFDKEQ